MRALLLFVVLTTFFYSNVCAQQQSLTQKKTVVIHSNSENVSHEIYVQLPVDYEKVNLHYPVIILLDAQDVSLFNYSSNAIDRLMGTNDIPNAIFVGVLQKDRQQELSVERGDSSTTRFRQFIENDLISYLKKSYPINNYFTFIGHSLGGQFLTDAMMTSPVVFKSVISISGALNYPSNDEEYSFYHRKVLSRMEQYSTTGLKTKQKYYFCVGNEGMQDEMFRTGALNADSMLTEKQLPHFDWCFNEFKQFNHMTTPLVGIPAGLVFIFHDWHFSEQLAMNVLLNQKVDPITAVQQHQLQVNQSYGADIALPGFIFYQFTQFCLGKKDLNRAKWLITQLVDRFPNDDKPLEMMADILLKLDNTKEAVTYLKKAYSVSNKEKYRKRLDELEGKK